MAPGCPVMIGVGHKQIILIFLLFFFFFPPLSFHVKLEVVGGCGFNKAGEGIQQEGFRSGVLVSKGEGHVKISHWSALAFFGPVPFL